MSSMKVININIGTPFQSFSLRLDDRDFILKLKWNFRRSAWSMSVFDLDKNPIQHITTMLVNSTANLITVRNPEAPQGLFTIIDTAGEDTERPETPVRRPSCPPFQEGRRRSWTHHHHLCAGRIVSSCTPGHKDRGKNLKDSLSLFGTLPAGSL